MILRFPPERTGMGVETVMRIDAEDEVLETIRDTAVFAGIDPSGPFLGFVVGDRGGDTTTYTYLIPLTQVVFMYHVQPPEAPRPQRTSSGIALPNGPLPPDAINRLLRGGR